MLICVDFDGTCVTHQYPNIGEDLPGVVDVLKDFILNGHQIILYTMRSGAELQQAVEWFKLRDIALYDVNHSPGQEQWTSSPKVYSHMYIDDAALGCPLIQNLGERAFVDWKRVREILVGDGTLQDRRK